MFPHVVLCHTTRCIRKGRYVVTNISTASVSTVGKYNRELLQIRPLRDQEKDIVWDFVTKNLKSHLTFAFMKKFILSPANACAVPVSSLITYALTQSIQGSLIVTLLLSLSFPYILFQHIYNKYEEQYREEKSDLFAYYTRPGCAFWVATYNNKIVGTSGICKKSDSRAEFRRMSVDATFRHKGIAEALTQKAVDFSRKNGYDDIVLFTSDAQLPALKLYNKCGFRVDKHVENTYLMGLVSNNVHRLRMSLK